MLISTEKTWKIIYTFEKDYDLYARRVDLEEIAESAGCLLELNLGEHYVSYYYNKPLMRAYKGEKDNLEDWMIEEYKDFEETIERLREEIPERLKKKLNRKLPSGYIKTIEVECLDT